MFVSYSVFQCILMDFPKNEKDIIDTIERIKDIFGRSSNAGDLNNNGYKDNEM